MYDLSHSSLAFYPIFDNSFISYMNLILGKKSSGFIFFYSMSILSVGFMTIFHVFYAQ